MAVPPPLDEITKLPAIGVDIIQQQFNKLVEQTLDATKEVITDSVKLPKSIKCDDPRIEKMKADLEQVTKGIQKVQETIPQVQNIISIVKTVITTAQSVKAAIAVAQLSNPATGAQDGSGIDDVDDIDDYNDLLSSEFYRDVNVSEPDLVQRSNTIQQLVQEKQDLLTSLQEAPSQVYKQAGAPPAELGKPGDYYIDIQTNTPYGPKKSRDTWGGPIN